MENTIYKKTQLGLVPSEWKEIVFGDIFEEVSETTNDTDHYPLYSLTIEDGVTPKSERYERSFLITKETDSYKVVKKDEFVYNPMNLRFGALARLKEDKEVAVSGYYNVFKVKPGYSPEFMDYYLKSERMMYLYNAYATGSLKEKQRVHYSQFIQFQLPLPSIEEAKRITEILTKWDNAIELKEKLIDQKKEQKKGLMQKLLTGETRLDGFKEPWKKVKLGSIATIIMGQSPKSDSYNELKEGIPLIQGNADIKNRRTLPRMWTTNPTKICHPEDILMTVRAPVGSIALSEHEACLGRGVCAIKANINSEYLYYQLIRRENMWGKIAQGSTFESINSNDIKDLIIEVPTEKEQIAIAKVLKVADKYLSLLKRELEELNSQKQALMQQLLTGKIRVKV